MRTFIHNLLLALLIINSSSIFSQNFVTKWQLPPSQDSLSFYLSAQGGDLNYTWETIPAGTSGSGTFLQGSGIISVTGLPMGSMIRLSMEPTFLKVFKVGSNLDELNLIDVESWGTANWTNLTYAFSGCTNLQITATDIPDLSNVTSLSNLFYNCTNLNSPFNIGQWNTSTITKMDHVFDRASSFNQDLSTWNTSQVDNMAAMFQLTEAFNQDISIWNTSNVQLMTDMFDHAYAFNQDISQWNVSSVEDVYAMFRNATSFNQYLGDWNLSSMLMMGAMLNDSGMDCDNYSATLVAWASNPTTPFTLNLGALNLEYAPLASASRDNLININGWIITGDSQGSINCTLGISSQDNFEIKSYPNPTNDILKIESEILIDEVIVTDLIGNIILKLSPTSDYIQIDLSSCLKGLYTVKVSSENGSVQILKVNKE